MPTGSEPGAAEAARREATIWHGMAMAWKAGLHPLVWADIPGREADVVGRHDPVEDLKRRTSRWGYSLGDGDFADLSRFASALALAESDAWADDRPHVATRAYEDRRFLVADRLIHWAIPWLDAVGRSHPGSQAAAEDALDHLLLMGDEMRVAPELAAGEGRHPPGHDAYGPLEWGAVEDGIDSLWSGGVVTGATISSMTIASHTGCDELPALAAVCERRVDLSEIFDMFTLRWRRLADAHEGSAELWRALSRRAERTAKGLRESVAPPHSAPLR